MNKVLIAIPTYNEIENIRQMVEMILAKDNRYHVLIIDDNSPDGTGDLMAAFVQKEPRAHVIRRSGKLGLGSAYLKSFQFAIDEGYDAVVQMDADFSHHPKYLHPLVSLLGEADLAIGSRYVRGGGTKNWGLIRKIISRGGSWYSKTILGVPIEDLTGGFNAWRVSKLKTLPLDTIRSEGYSFQIEMKYTAFRYGFRIKETPILFEDRTLGNSKMSRRIVLEAIYRVWGMKLRAKTPPELLSS